MQARSGFWLRDASACLARRCGSGRVSSTAARTRRWLVSGLLLAVLASSPWSVWQVGWFRSGARAASAPGLSLSSPAGVVQPGATFSVDIIADCGSRADAVAFAVTFNPAQVQVASVTPDTSQFPNALLAASYDNVAGWVRYEAGSLACHSAGSCPTGPVHLATIQFTTAGLCGVATPLAVAGQLTWEGAYTFDGSGAGSTIAITIAGDVNADGLVDVQDIMLVATHWSSAQGEALYDARYDLDADGDIDVVDIMLVAARWNQQCGGQALLAKEVQA